MLFSLDKVFYKRILSPIPIWFEFELQKMLGAKRKCRIHSCHRNGSYSLRSIVTTLEVIRRT